jgi:superfamily II DNA or RNA helicase
VGGKASHLAHNQIEVDSISTPRTNMTELYSHQKDFLNLNPNKSSLVWSCGTGKTRTALEWSKLAPHYSILVICPKALKANWIREIKKYGGENGKLNYWQVLTKEEFRANWEKIDWHATVIVDEVHNGFLTPNFKSQMSKALRSYLKKNQVPRVLLLSATVYTSSPWNIYNLAFYTGHVWNWATFKNKYFYDVQMGFRRIPMPKKNIEKQLAEDVKKIASVIDIHDVMDVPLQNHLDPEYFALSKEQEKAIKDNYDPLPIVRYTAQHEIENGILIGNEFREDQVFESDKMERIKQLCEENKKVAIVCRYNKQIDELSRLGFGKPLFVIRGDVSDRDAITLLAEQAKECIVLIQADCAEGYQLPSFELCIFASQSYSYTKWEQICGRFLRMDKPSRTTFMYLLTEGESIDQAVFDSVKNRQNFQIELYKNPS